MPKSWTDGLPGGAGAVEVGEVLTAGVVDQAVALVGRGALVSFGASRDGGSVAITVTYDGDWDRQWFRDGEPAAEWLTRVAAALDSFGPPAAEPVSTRRRKRVSQA